MHSNLSIELDGSFFFSSIQLETHSFDAKFQLCIIRNPCGLVCNAKNHGLDDDTLLFAHSHIIRFRLSRFGICKCQFDERPLTGNAVNAKRYWFILLYLLYGRRFINHNNF